MGKGSGRRPLKVSVGEFNNSWDRIFKKTNKLREKDGKNKSDSTDAAKAKERWVDHSSDC